MPRVGLNAKKIYICFNGNSFCILKIVYYKAEYNICSYIHMSFSESFSFDISCKKDKHLRFMERVLPNGIVSETKDAVRKFRLTIPLSTRVEHRKRK